MVNSAVGCCLLLLSLSHAEVLNTEVQPSLLQMAPSRPLLPMFPLMPAMPSMPIMPFQPLLPAAPLNPYPASKPLPERASSERKMDLKDYCNTQVRFIGGNRFW